MAKEIVLYLYILVLCYCPRLQCQEIDYYWRDYNGAVPTDAFPAGKDATENDTFIGQAYLYGYGLFVGQIFPHAKSVEVPCTGKYYNQIYKIENPLKILCTQHKANFYWIPTSSSTFHTDTIGKHVVVGGYNGQKEGNYGIGRLMYDSILRIGGVVTFKVDHAHMYFVHKNRVEKVNTFEVLLYNKTATNATSVDAMIDIRKFTAESQK